MINHSFTAFYGFVLGKDATKPKAQFLEATTGQKAPKRAQLAGLCPLKPPKKALKTSINKKQLSLNFELGGGYHHLGFFKGDGKFFRSTRHKLLTEKG